MSRFPTPTRRLLTAALLIALTTPAWAPCLPGVWQRAVTICC